MIENLIDWCARHRWPVFGLTLALVLWSLDSIRNTPLDAIPDLSDPQVIVFSDWMGRSPDLVEDQVTYPLVRVLQSTPGVQNVRGYSMFGMSFIYVIFNEQSDIYWARTRVLEQLGRAQSQLPPGVTPTLGPDASGVGWVFQYVLHDERGRFDAAQLRALQDFTVRPALQAVTGVSEVASLGGFERQYQVLINPERLTAYGISVSEVSRAVVAANSEVGARVLEQAGREFVLRGRGYVRELADLESSVVAVAAGGVPIQLRDVARVQFGPDIRRGAADWNGNGEAVGGIVVMRIGANALDVIDAVKQQIATLNLPDGVRLVPTYDRSELIRGSIRTLRNTLLEEGVIVAVICLAFLMHAGSAVVVMIILPLSVLFSFIAMRYLGLTSNIMSLGGIAIAIGELTDAAIVLIENAHTRLARAGPGSDRREIIISACKEVGRPIFYSLLLITVSFLPIFTLAEQAGRLFSPLAFTKTFAMFAAAVLSVTLAPPLMVWLLRGRFRGEEENPLNRLLGKLYRPIVRRILRRRLFVSLSALVLILATVPLFWRLGSEFMPPLDEGSLLVMPTTFPGISVEEARRALRTQDRIIASFAEVASVHGKTGRADTATDPAQLDMNEIVVLLKPRQQWPQRPVQRWYSSWAPEPLQMVLRPLWPDVRAWTQDELIQALDRALQMPGYQMAIAPPVRTRIDMLTTGVRTPVGIKVFGQDLAEIERLSLQLEGLLRQVPGTRSTFAERQTGREYVDIVPDRESIARYGLTVQDVLAVIETAVGGMSVSTVIDGRARYSVNVRYAMDFRADPESLRNLPVQIAAVAGLAEPNAGVSGQGATAADAMPAMAASGGGMQMNAGSRRSGGSAAMTESTPTARAMAGGNYDAEAGFVASGTAVPLRALADVRVVNGPPMIKDENGVLVGYVFADIDSQQRDLGGWVADAKQLVAAQFVLPEGYRLQWTGQYEFMADMQERMQLVLPLTLLLVVGLLFLSLRGWPQTALVLLSLPFAVAGSVWLLALLQYHLSTAVWVGLIAVIGVAAQTGIVVVVYLDQAFQQRLDSGLLQSVHDIDEAVVEGAAKCLRPMLMTVATTVLGLMPLLWESGVGADLSARTAAPVVGGLWACMFLTLMVLPAVYAIWRRWQFHSASHSHD
ncbi:MAG: efflux RND transporter permease subunit [Pseudomonadota bacterium]